jgi:hypothetical protein
MSAAEEVREALEEVCLRGLHGAGSALVGHDPAPVAAAFAQWRGEARRVWPWLPGLCYDALEPLGVEFPADDADAVVLGRLLVAAETDAGAIEDALARLGRRLHGGGERRPSEAALQATGILRWQSLLSAVERFWADLTAVTRRLHDPVAVADRDAVDWIIINARRQLESTVERVPTLAGAVADGMASAPPVSAPSPSPAPPASAPSPSPAPPPPPPVDEPAPAAPAPDLPASVAGAATDEIVQLTETAPFAPIEVEASGAPPAPAPPSARAPSPSPAPSPPPPPPPASPPRPTPPSHRPAPGAAPRRAPGTPTARTSDASRPPRRPAHAEDVEYRRVREHTYAPIVFALLAIIAALVVLATVGPST